MGDIDGFAVLDRHHGRTLGAGFTDMAALEVAREHNIRVLMQHLTAVHMPERPVVVALGDQLVEAARRVGGVTFASFQGGVEDADVEDVGHWIGVTGKEVFGHRPFRKAPAVQDNPEFVEPEGLGFAGTEHTDVVGQRQGLGNQALGVVIPVENEYRNSGLVQAAHLFGKEQPGTEIAPRAVIEVTSDHDEVHPLVACTVHQRFEGGARCRGESAPRGRPRYPPTRSTGYPGECQRRAGIGRCSWSSVTVVIVSGIRRQKP